MSYKNQIIQKLDEVLNKDDLENRIKLQVQITGLVKNCTLSFTSLESTRSSKSSLLSDLELFVHNPESFRNLLALQKSLFVNFIID